MRRINVTKAKAKAKTQFSAVLAQVEAGEEIVITRRGVAIARIVAEPAPPTPNFDLRELFHFTNAQPLHQGPDGGSFLAELRRDARF
jgi:prevent-host-death family protein